MHMRARVFPKKRKSFPLSLEKKENISLETKTRKIVFLNRNYHLEMSEANQVNNSGDKVASLMKEAENLKQKLEEERQKLNDVTRKMKKFIFLQGHSKFSNSFKKF